MNVSMCLIIMEHHLAKAPSTNIIEYTQEKHKTINVPFCWFITNETYEGLLNKYKLNRQWTMLRWPLFYQFDIPSKKKYLRKNKVPINFNRDTSVAVNVWWWGIFQENRWVFFIYSQTPCLSCTSQNKTHNDFKPLPYDVAIMSDIIHTFTHI